MEEVKNTPVQEEKVSSGEVVQSPAKKKSSKAIWILIAVIVVLTLCCGASFIFGFFAYIGSAIEYVSNDNQVVVDEILNDLANELEEISSTEFYGEDLMVIETDKYSFYYPVGYEKSEMEGIAHMYSSTVMNNDSGSANINLTIDSAGGQEGISATYQDCKEYSEQMKGLYEVLFSDNFSVVYVDSFSQQSGASGCQVNYLMEGSEARLDQRVVLAAEEDNYYVVTIAYDLDSDDSTILQEAQMKFTLK